MKKEKRTDTTVKNNVQMIIVIDGGIKREIDEG